MRTRLLLALFVAGLAAFAAQTTMAKEAKVSCGQIKRALRSGKSQEQVAKDLKVSADVVKGCTQRHEK
jgi:transposase